MSVKDEIIAYLSQYRKSNICLPKLFFCKGEISEKDNSVEISESLFGKCDKKEGLQVWLINHKNKNPSYLEKKPEKLSNQSNYIFLKTHKKLFYHKGALILKPNYLYEIYYWIGDNNNIKNNFAVCYYTTLLSAYLNNCQVISGKNDSCQVISGKNDPCQVRTETNVPCQIFREKSGEESDRFKKILN